MLVSVFFKLTRDFLPTKTGSSIMIDVAVILVSEESFNRGTMRPAMQFISKTEPAKPDA